MSPTPLEQFDEAMRLLELARVGLVPVTGRTILVPPGSDVQAAINHAVYGDTIKFTAGATYPGSFVLPAKSGTGFITLTTTGDLPPRRVRPMDGPIMPKFQALPGGDPAIRTELGAHHYQLIGMEVLGNPGGFNDQIRLGDGSTLQTRLDDVARNLILDRCFIHGDPVNGQKRGIALNSADTVISRCYLSDIKVEGQDSQAIDGWNGPGPYSILDNYIEAAGENILFGGTDAAITGLIPGDIAIAGNTLTKPFAWRFGRWQVKNLFELKNARRVVFEQNDLSNCWGPVQGGFGIQLTPRNQDGTAPWSTVEDVTIRTNTFTGMAGAINFLGADNNHPSGRMARIEVVGNVWNDIDPWKWAGNDKLFQILDGPIDVTIEANVITGQHIGSILYFDGTPKALRLKFVNNKYPTSLYDIFGGNSMAGGDPIPHAWRDYVEDGTLSGNAIIG